MHIYIYIYTVHILSVDKYGSRPTSLRIVPIVFRLRNFRNCHQASVFKICSSWTQEFLAFFQFLCQWLSPCESYYINFMWSCDGRCREARKMRKGVFCSKQAGCSCQTAFIVFLLTYCADMTPGVCIVPNRGRLEQSHPNKISSSKIQSKNHPFKARSILQRRHPTCSNLSGSSVKSTSRRVWAEVLFR